MQVQGMGYHEEQVIMILHACDLARMFTPILPRIIG